MGLFLSMDKNIVEKHILPYLTDYLDRLHFAKTCAYLWNLMSTKDQIVWAIKEKQYHKLLCWVSFKGNEEATIRLAKRIHHGLSPWFCWYDQACQGQKSFAVIKTLKDLTRGLDDRWRKEVRPTYENIEDGFDMNVIHHIFKTFRGNVPQQFLDLFPPKHWAICAGWARYGNLQKFTESFRERVHHDALESIAEAAGKGLCREIYIPIWEMGYQEEVFRGICKSKNLKAASEHLVELLYKYPKKFEECKEQLIYNGYRDLIEKHFNK